MPLPLPEIRRGTYRWDSTERVLVRDVFADWARVGGETYLDLWDLDLGDANAILSFANRHSQLGLHDAEAEAEWPFLRPTLFDFRTPIESETILLRLARRGAHHLLVDENQRLRKIASFPALSEEAIETREEFVLAAQIIRDAVRMWRAVQENQTVAEITPESSLARELLLQSANPAHSARSSIPVGAFLDWFFAEGLRVFHPRIDMSRRREIPTTDYPELVVPNREFPYAVRLYEACALELYNHVAEQGHYKICENETCRRLFVHQEGRSDRKHRDAKYHTRHCANAQAQRQFRRRQAAKNAGFK